MKTPEKRFCQTCGSLMKSSWRRAGNFSGQAGRPFFVAHYTCMNASFFSRHDDYDWGPLYTDEEIELNQIIEL